MKKKIFDEIKLNPDLLKDFIFRNNIKGKILKITHLPFKKILILIKYKEDISILKICHDPYSIKLSNNENKSYKIIKKNNLNFINILPFRKIRSKKNLSLTVIKFINGKKANFFEFNNFYKFTNLNKTKNFSINNYINKKRCSFILYIWRY